MSRFSAHLFSSSCLLLLLTRLFSGTAAFAMRPDSRPGKAILLADSRQFIAQDSLMSVALYRSPEKVPRRRFPASAPITQIALSSNEQLLLLACEDGSLGLWDVKSGKRLWEKRSAETGLEYIYDASMSYDGNMCVAGGVGGRALVLETRTGRHLAEIRCPPGQTSIMSVALAPDGRAGVLVDLGNGIYTFEVATSGLTYTGFKGAKPIRYSAKGKYIACASGRSGVLEHLRILSIGERLGLRDLGEFETIGHIRPAADGSFLITGIARRLPGETTRYLGVQVWPEEGKLRELWRFPNENTLNQETDFLPDTMTGTSTYFMLKSYLTDLRTGAIVMSVDNSENWRPRLATSSSFGVGWMSLLWIGVGLVLAGVLVYFSVRRPHPP